jgi:polar amino acid transport system substrate-binding protein
MSLIARFAVATLLMLPLPALAEELIVLVDTGTDMPMARFEHHRLVGGIHKDIGMALAKHMARTLKFVALPRKRIVNALEKGQADILCSYVPQWLDGRFGWSTPFIPIVEVLITVASAPRPASLAELAGQPIGTVLGYAHPALEEALGSDFVREDGPTSDANLRKLAAGRVQHAVTGKSFLEYRLKQGDLPLKLHPPLVVRTYKGQCAVSPKGRVTIGEVNRAIGMMTRDGTVAAIMARYQ